MEALWTRFLPAVTKARSVIDKGTLGAVSRAEASLVFHPPFDPNHRLFDPALGGGVLLDLGVYPISVASYLLGKPRLADSSWQSAPTGVDARAQLSLRCGGVPVSISVGFCDNMADEGDNAFVVYGDKGTLRIDRHFLRADRADNLGQPGWSGAVRKRICGQIAPPHSICKRRPELAFSAQDARAVLSGRSCAIGASGGRDGPRDDAGHSERIRTGDHRAGVGQGSRSALIGFAVKVLNDTHEAAHELFHITKAALKLIRVGQAVAGDGVAGRQVEPAFKDADTGFEFVNTLFEHGPVIIGNPAGDGAVINGADRHVTGLGVHADIAVTGGLEHIAARFGRMRVHGLRLTRVPPRKLWQQMS